MFAKTSWMSKGYIARAVRFLENIKKDEFNEYSKNEKDAAEEGIACLKNAKPGYLLNLIQQDHPDRINAVRLLTEPLL